MDFFNSCKDKEEAKRVYRNLCKHFHPDKGGDPELMKKLQEQYDKFKPYSQKETLDNMFTSQRFYGASNYSFNRINRGFFDSTDQILINGLKDKINFLEKKCVKQQHELFESDNEVKKLKQDLILMKNHYQHQLEGRMKEQHDNMDLRNQIDHMENQIKSLKSVSVKDMTILDFIKNKWGILNEK